MVALIRYWLAVLLHSQRYFPPLLFLLVGVVVLTANGAGPLVGAYGSCCAVLFLASLWLTVALISVDDPVQRAITVVNARGPGAVLTGAVLVAVLCCLPALAFGLAFPILSGQHAVGAAAIAVGAVSQLGAGLTGIAIGLVCSRLVVRRPALSLVLAVILAIAAFIVNWASPLSELLRQLASDRSPSRLLGPVTGLTMAAAVLLAVLAAAAQFVAVRRD